jgi:HK97 family phage portal protein
MGIFDRFKQNTEETVLTGDTLLQALVNRNMLSREQIKTIPQVAADLDLVTSTFATIPFRLYRHDVVDGKDVVVRVSDDPRVAMINEDTRDTLDAFQMKKAVCEDYFLGYNGGGYVYIKKEGNRPTGLYYVKSEDVSIIENFEPIFKEYKLNVFAKLYEPYEFIKLLRNTRNGMYGESIVREVNDAMQAAYEAILFQVKTLKRGGNKKGFLTSKRKLSEPEIKLLKDTWRYMYSSATDNAPVLNEGVEFKESSSNPTELQINESIETLNKEIDALFHLSDNHEDFIRYAILPIGKAFETSLNRDFLREDEKGRYFWAADYSELLKASMKERYEAYEKAKSSGWITINEIRKMENMEAIDGMNVLNVGLGAALYSVDGEINTDRFYVPNTDTERNQSSTSETEKGDTANE